MQQTALEQSILIGGLVRSYAVLRLGRVIPREREFSGMALQDLEHLTAQLQADGFLPKTQSGASFATDRSSGIGAQAMQAAREYLQDAGKHVADHVRKHGIRYLMGASVTDHAYLTEEQKSAVNAINLASSRVQEAIVAACDETSRSYDPATCSAVTSEALNLMTTPPGPGSTWQNWLLFSGVAASLFYYFIIRRP